MDVFYNNQPFKATLVFKAGRTINMSFIVYQWDTVTSSWILYDLTGKRIDMQFRRPDGLLMKSLTTFGSTEITIVTTSFNLFAPGFLNEDFMEYDVKVTDGAKTFDLMEGYSVIKKHITP